MTPSKRFRRVHHGVDDVELPDYQQSFLAAFFGLRYRLGNLWVLMERDRGYETAEIGLGKAGRTHALRPVFEVAGLPFPRKETAGALMEAVRDHQFLLERVLADQAGQLVAMERRRWQDA